MNTVGIDISLSRSSSERRRGIRIHLPTGLNAQRPLKATLVLSKVLAGNCVIFLAFYRATPHHLRTRHNVQAPTINFRRRGRECTSPPRLSVVIKLEPHPIVYLVVLERYVVLVNVVPLLNADLLRPRPRLRRH